MKYARKVYGFLPGPLRGLARHCYLLLGGQRRIDRETTWRTRHLLRNPEYVYEKEIRLLPRLLTPGSVAFDIGANDGVYSYYMAYLAGPSGRVVAVEPGRRAFQALKIMVGWEGLENVTLRRAAIGAAPGKINLYVPEYTKVARIECGEPAEGEREVVELETVDRLVGEYALKRVDLMKVDVEGAEQLVLEGARRTLDEFKPHLILELADVHLVKFKTDGERVIGLLRSHGYRCFEYDWDSRKLSEVDRISLKGGHTWSTLDEDLSTNNYIFIHKDKLGSMRPLIGEPAGALTVSTTNPLERLAGS